MKVEWIRRAAREARVWWSYHAAQKLMKERLQRREIENGMKDAEVIEWYLMEGRPHPGALVLLRLRDGSPLHAVVAMDESRKRLYVVTVYRPLKEKWSNGWKTRKE